MMGNAAAHTLHDPRSYDASDAKGRHEITVSCNCCDICGALLVNQRRKMAPNRREIRQRVRNEFRLSYSVDPAAAPSLRSHSQHAFLVTRRVQERLAGCAGRVVDA